MKLEVETGNGGYIVYYTEDTGVKSVPYIYKMTEEFKMLQDISKRFLRLEIYVKEK